MLTTAHCQSASTSWSMRHVFASYQTKHKFSSRYWQSVAFQMRPAATLMQQVNSLRSYESRFARSTAGKNGSALSSLRGAETNHSGTHSAIFSQNLLTIDRPGVFLSSCRPLSLSGLTLFRGRLIHAGRRAMTAIDGDENPSSNQVPAPASRSVLAAASAGMCVAIAASNALVCSQIHSDSHPQVRFEIYFALCGSSQCPERQTELAFSGNYSISR